MTHFAVAAVLAAFAFGGSALAQTSPKVTALSPPPKTVLFVGNSFFYFNNSMHRYLRGLIAQGDPRNRRRYRQVSVTISASSFSWHDVESYLEPGRMAARSIAEDGSIEDNAGAPFDAVILSDCSQCPIHPRLKDAFHEYTRRHVQAVAKHGAKPVLFMTWAYQDQPEMTAQLAEQYTLAGNANDALVVPAGLAFAKSIAKNPQLNLYYVDKRHPSLAGTYLGAATIYAALYGKSPVGLKYYGGLDEKTAVILQQAAWEAVREYYGK